MDKLSPIQKLDLVLKFFARSPFEKGGLTFDDSRRIFNEKNNLDIEGHEFSKIIEQLLSDGYIVHEQREGPSPSGSHWVKFVLYKSTYKGIIFDSQKGYSGEIEKQEASDNRVEALENRQMENQTKLNTLTVWIAVATCVSAVGTVIAASWYWLHLNK